MNLRKITILLLTVLLSLPMAAQKRKRVKAKAKPVPVVEEPQEDPRITNMRQMTQKIIIIDSIVANKDQFLASIRLSSECGQLMNTSTFFRNQLQGTLYINEMGNKVYFSQPDGDKQQLYTADKLGNEWSKPQPLQGLNEGIDEAAYPFMLTDGVTFYFAGKGEESIGGYDIFMTRYDSRSGSFLKPENIGMPFNSEANDYMYAIDETNRIGYFVSDRRQPEGKVCIYIFIPSETRKTYDTSALTEEQLRSLADIASIADTWGDGTERRKAMERLAQARRSFASRQTVGSGTSKRQSELDTMRQKADKQRKALAEARRDYSIATPEAKALMKDSILRAERDQEELLLQIRQKEKAERNNAVKSRL